MYDIGISEIICTAKYEDTTHIIIKYDAEAAKRPELCSNPNCGAEKPIRPHVHSKRTNLLRDVRSEGKLVIINLTVKHYRCPHCGNVTADEFSFYNKNSHMTNRLRNEFVRRCIKGETFSYIANDYGVDHKTVAAAFRDYAAHHEELLQNDYTPEALGIDEVYIDDRYRLVLTDIKNKSLIDIKKDNYKPTVKKYLKGLDPNICKCATMDFAPGYDSCVSTVLPSTVIVVDKFHVIQELNRCLDNVRKDIQSKLRSDGVDMHYFKKSRSLFLTNWEDLSPEAENKLSEWFTQFPDLYEAYMVKEVFRDIYRSCKDKSEASELFEGWLEIIPDYKHFQAMRKTFASRKMHILNYWDYQWTNVYTESVNNQIKQIEKKGRGYKFEVLRERCLLEINQQKPEVVDPRESNYEMVSASLVGFADSACPCVANYKSIYTATAQGIQLSYSDNHDGCLTKMYIDSCQIPNADIEKRLKMYHNKLTQWQKKRGLSL